MHIPRQAPNIKRFVTEPVGSRYWILILYYLHNNRIVWAWSAKCACTCVKALWFNCPPSDEVHKANTCKRALPNQTFTESIWWIRNPYTRFVAGFADICIKRGMYPDLTLRNFITNFSYFQKSSQLIQHHFEPQTRHYIEQDWTLRNVEIFDFKLPKTNHTNAYSLIPSGSILDIKAEDFPASASYKQKYFLEDEVIAFIESIYEEDFIAFANRGIKFSISSLD